jgi:hypothetical protein
MARGGSGLATKADIDAEITLELDGADLTPDRFQQAVRAFFGMLEEVTKSVCQGKPRVEWRVQVKQSSNLIGVNPVPGFRPETVGLISSSVYSGIASLGEDRVEYPPHFHEEARRHAHELAKIVAAKPGLDFSMRVWSKTESLEITDRLAAAEDLVNAQYVEDYGSIDGKLQAMSDRNNPQFFIYETLSDRRIPCLLTKREQWEAVTASFRKRVEVYGLIRYTQDGAPIRIRVDEIVPFPDRKTIPDFSEVRGILRVPD